MFGAEVGVGNSAAGKSQPLSQVLWVASDKAPRSSLLFLPPGVYCCLPTFSQLWEKIAIKSQLYFKYCHKNARDGACGILFGGWG